METLEGIGALGMLTAFAFFVLALFPAFWLRWAARNGASVTRLREASVLTVTLALCGLAVIPASIYNFGWVILPLGFVLVSATYALTHRLVIRTLAAQGRREPMWSLFGFAAVLGLVLVAVLVGSAQQGSIAAHADDESMRKLSTSGVASIVVLGAVPPVIALAMVGIDYRRSRESGPARAGAVRR